MRRASVDEGLHGLLEARDAFDPEAGAFVREGALRDRPATMQLADEVLAWHDDVGEEHLGEVGLPR